MRVYDGTLCLYIQCCVFWWRYTICCSSVNIQGKMPLVLNEKWKILNWILNLILRSNFTCFQTDLNTNKRIKQNNQTNKASKHTFTRLECQQMARWRSAAPSTKLSLRSSPGEPKRSSVHSPGSRYASHSRRQVRDRLRRLSLSRKENRCSRHSVFSSVRCMVELLI